MDDFRYRVTGIDVGTRRLSFCSISTTTPPEKWSKNKGAPVVVCPKFDIPQWLSIDLGPGTIEASVSAFIYLVLGGGLSGPFGHVRHRSSAGGEVWKPVHEEHIACDSSCASRCPTKLQSPLYELEDEVHNMARAMWTKGEGHGIDKIPELTGDKEQCDQTRPRYAGPQWKPLSPRRLRFEMHQKTRAQGPSGLTRSCSHFLGQGYLTLVGGAHAFAFADGFRSPSIEACGPGVAH